MNAAEYGDIPPLEMLKNCNCSWNSGTLVNAVYSQRIEIVKWRLNNVQIY